MSCVLFDEKLFADETENVKIEVIEEKGNDEKSDVDKKNDITDTDFEPKTDKKKKFPCYYCEKTFATRNGYTKKSQGRGDLNWWQRLKEKCITNLFKTGDAF